MQQEGIYAVANEIVYEDALVQDEWSERMLAEIPGEELANCHLVRGIAETWTILGKDETFLIGDTVFE